MWPSNCTRARADRRSFGTDKSYKLHRQRVADAKRDAAAKAKAEGKGVKAQ